jgi:hypothetical protein
VGYSPTCKLIVKSSGNIGISTRNKDCKWRIMTPDNTAIKYFYWIFTSDYENYATSTSTIPKGNTLDLVSKDL